jgi:hypothetical protein
MHGAHLVPAQWGRFLMTEPDEFCGIHVGK